MSFLSYLFLHGERALSNGSFAAVLRDDQQSSSLYNVVNASEFRGKPFRGLVPDSTGTTPRRTFQSGKNGERRQNVKKDCTLSYYLLLP